MIKQTIKAIHLAKPLSPSLISFRWYNGDRALHLLYTTVERFLITKSSPCNEDPLTPHFYIVKLGITGVYMFSCFCSKT